MAKEKVSETALKKPHPWLAFCVPPVLLLVALSTYLKDRLFLRLLPRRRYESYVFVPRAGQTTFSEDRSQTSDPVKSMKVS